MDFGDILEEWEKKHRASRSGNGRSEGGRSGGGKGGSPMEELLERYPPPEGLKRGTDAGAEGREGAGEAGTPQGAHGAEGRGRLRAMEPQAVLDLHGLSGLEAERALDRFLLECRARGLRKVLIVHGKGNHSVTEPVLKGVVRAYLEKCPYTGASGDAEKRYGGRGATWVVLR
jgi:hypothetical protein